MNHSNRLAAEQGDAYGPPLCEACARSADIDSDTASALRAVDEATWTSAAHRFPTVTIRLADGTAFEMLAEPTDVPGLYLTPEVGAGPSFRNGWKLTHGPSGVAFPYRGPSPEHVRELARALAAVRADWTTLPADVQEWPDALLQQINAVGGAWEMRRHRRTQPEFFWPVQEEATSA